MKNILTSIVVSLMFSVGAHAADSDIKGAEIVQALSLACADQTWKPFAMWVTETKFYDRIIPNKTVQTISGNTIHFDSSSDELRILAKNKIEYKTRSGTFRGVDLCDLAMQVEKKLKDKQSRFSFSFSSVAWADDLVKEDKADDRIYAGSFAVLTLLAAVPPAEVLGFATAAFMLKHLASLKIKGEFEDILNNKFKLFCDSTEMTIQGEDGKKIVVFKTSPADRIVLESDKGETILGNQLSFVAEKSRQFLVQNR